MGEIDRPEPAAAGLVVDVADRLLPAKERRLAATEAAEPGDLLGRPLLRPGKHNQPRPLLDPPPQPLAPVTIEPGVGNDDHVGFLDAPLVEEIGANHLDVEAAGDPLLPFDLRAVLAEGGREALARRLERGGEEQSRISEPLDAGGGDDDDSDAALDIEDKEHRIIEREGIGGEVEPGLDDSGPRRHHRQRDAHHLAGRNRHRRLRDELVVDRHAQGHLDRRAIRGRAVAGGLDPRCQLHRQAHDGALRPGRIPEQRHVRR